MSAKRRQPEFVPVRFQLCIPRRLMPHPTRLSYGRASNCLKPLPVEGLSGSDLVREAEGKKGRRRRCMTWWWAFRLQSVVKSLSPRRNGRVVLPTLPSGWELNNYDSDLISLLTTSKLFIGMGQVGMFCSSTYIRTVSITSHGHEFELGIRHTVTLSWHLPQLAC